MKKTIPSKTLYIFCEQFSAMLKVGIQLEFALEAAIEQTTDRRMKKILFMALKKIDEGSTLCEAFDSTNAFPPIFINMIEAGEITGSLDHSFDSLTLFFKKQGELKSKISKAFLQPCIVVILMIVVTGLFMFKILPSFESVFEFSGARLPEQTQNILNLRIFILENKKRILILLPSCIILLKALLNIKLVKYLKDMLMLYNPLTHRITVALVNMRFANTLSMMLQSGIYLLEAIEVSSKCTNNTFAESQILKLQEPINNGEPLFSSMTNKKVFGLILRRMVQTGEETGYLESMLKKSADFYEADSNRLLDQIITIIEPISLFLIAIPLSYLAIAVAMPMFSLFLQYL